jgi:DNA repair exonuclease SbcCD ATPase subunit
MGLMDAKLTKEAAKLYALPAGEFTAARNARAKKLRADDADLAAAVAKLAKPTVAAAAVNRLARDQPSETRELVQAGKRLREAQERAVGGKGGPDDLQRAVADHRAALDRLQREARRLGLSEPILERVVRTIRAASIDPELQRTLERGVLAQEIESAGFGLDPGLVVPAAPKRTATKRAGDEAKRKKAQERLEAAEQALAELEDEARGAEAEVRNAEKAAAAARRKVERAEAEVERARNAL